MAKSSNSQNNTKSNEFKLPKYLKLAKGAMWLDIDGENCSGVKLYSGSVKLVGRGKVDEELVEGKLKAKLEQPDIPKDKYNNNDFIDFGYIEEEISDTPWYVDTSKIPSEKQSRLILAYKYKILVEADPKNPPKEIVENRKTTKDFATNKDGDLVFVGKNKEIYKKLQILNFNDLRSFIHTCPKTKAARQNLIDMYHYEIKGYNKIARPRGEVLDLIRDKLNEFGPTISSIRVNED